MTRRAFLGAVQAALIGCATPRSVGFGAGRLETKAGSAREGELDPVLNGIDVLANEGFAAMDGKRIGLITNHTGHDRGRRSTIDLLNGARGVRLTKLFSPEHGIRGVLDERVADGIDEKSGLRVLSLYGERRKPRIEELRDLDSLVFDIQDIGCRFYTYVSTMGLAMEAAAEAGTEFIVLDRVNPINGVAVEGPVFSGASRFTAFHSLPLRHGMTVGELAGMFRAERTQSLKLTVVRLRGWRRRDWLDRTGLPWTDTSPNMRSLAAATLYPGVGLLETAISVGRGTETPFEWVGAPYVDGERAAAELLKAGLDGVRFVPIQFTPKASVFAGRACGGVRFEITNREAMSPVDLGIVLALVLRRLYPDQFELEKVQTLLQDEPTMEAMRAGRALADIKALWGPGLAEFKARRGRYLLYS